jgi:phage recombination protein Bet
MSLTPEKRDLIARTCVNPRHREATPDEIALFLEQVERTGLDPLARQIYAQFRKSHGVEKMSIETSIDGFRLVAERTGRYMGQDEPQWCGEDGVWTDTWLRKEHPAAAKAKVRKVMGNLVAPTTAVAHWEEYAVTGPAGQFWQSKPALMIAKCAEALALRKAFPQELSGLYTAEEMAQADGPTTPEPLSVEPATPPQIKRIKREFKGRPWGDIKATCAEAGVTVEEPADIGKLTKADASAVIDRLVEGALPDSENPTDVPVPEGEFVHEKVSPEDFLEAFPGTVEESAA